MKSKLALSPDALRIFSSVISASNPAPDGESKDCFIISTVSFDCSISFVKEPIILIKRSNSLLNFSVVVDMLFSDKVLASWFSFLWISINCLDNSPPRSNRAALAFANDSSLALSDSEFNLFKYSIFVFNCSIFCMYLILPCSKVFFWLTSSILLFRH